MGCYQHSAVAEVDEAADDRCKISSGIVGEKRWKYSAGSKCRTKPPEAESFF